MIRCAVDKICVVRLSALGDIIHALAMVNAIKKAWPKTHLTWILQPLSHEVVKHQSNIDEFILYDGKKGTSAWLDLHRRLSGQRFDVALIPQVSVRASVIAAMINADTKLGFDFKRARELNWLFTNKKIPHRTPQHVQDQFFEFAEFLGIHTCVPQWGITFTNEELMWRESYFNKIDRPVISFVIATSDLQKDWYAKNYATVMDYVDANLNYQPMIVGGPSKREKTMADEILSLCRSKPVIALEKPVRHTMLQLSGSQVVVAPDTGPLHMAVAMDVPTIGLYGASDPRRCGPYKKYQDLLINKYPNSGETQASITRKLRPDKMARITPDDVIEKIDYAIKTYLAS